MRTYEYQLIINESCDEFWEELTGTGCEEVTSLIEEALFEAGFLVNSEETKNKLILTRYKFNES